MNAKTISSVSIAVAVVAASVFGWFYMKSKSEIARAEAKKVASEEAVASAAVKKAQSDERSASLRFEAEKRAVAVAEENRKTAKLQADAAAADAIKASADKERALAEKEKAHEERLKAEADAKKAADELALKKSVEAAAKAEADAKKSMADEAVAKATVAEVELERQKLAAEVILAEKRMYDLRVSNLEALEQELREYKNELDERERALRPELTIKDLASSNASQDDELSSDQLRENDYSLPRQTRMLYKSKREVSERDERLYASVRSNVVARLEALYEKAVMEDRVVDADFYSNAIRTMYPDWKYSRKAEEKEK